MLSPSDFNNAVPQFTNGNYASNPINPQYISEPDAESYNRGTEPLQTLPAQWWNWFINKFTARFNKVNIYVKNIFNELAQVLSIFNITPDGTEQTPTTSQLKTVFECCYPQYVKNDLYGNIAGTALGTAVVGTATTFARSDHVHPSIIQYPFIINPVNPPAGAGFNYNEGLRINQGYCGYADIFIGGLQNSLCGNECGFWIGTNNIENPGKLYINYQNSNQNSYFCGLTDGTVRWIGDVNGNLYGTATCADSATSASCVTSKVCAGLGNTTWDTAQAWGSNIGTTFAGWYDCDSGSIYFQCNNPEKGKMSMVIDGLVYVDEGRYPVIHTGNIGNQCVCYAGNAGNANTSNGTFTVNPGLAQHGYDEGIRINVADSGYAMMMIGTSGGTSGVCNGFWIGTNCISTPGKLYINYNNSNQPSYFENEGNGTVTWHGNVTGNLAGTANHATCATCDSDGNAINTTYAKKASFCFYPDTGTLYINM